MFEILVAGGEGGLGNFYWYQFPHLDGAKDYNPFKLWKSMSGIPGSRCQKVKIDVK